MDDWWLMGFISLIEHKRQAIPQEAMWRYPEFGWGQWLPGLNQTQRSDQTLVELWLQPNSAEDARWIKDAALEELTASASDSFEFDVLGIEDNGRLLPLANAVMDTPLNSVFMTLRREEPLTLSGAQRIFDEIVGDQDNLNDHTVRRYLDHKVPWFVAAYRKTSGQRLGDPALHASVHALGILAEQMGLEAWAVVASNRPWLQFALTAPSNQTMAECYIGSNYAAVNVWLRDTDIRSIAFEWPTGSNTSVQTCLCEIVKLVKQISLGEFDIRRSFRREPSVVVKGLEKRSHRGRGVRVERSLEGPLSFAFGGQ